MLDLGPHISEHLQFRTSGKGFVKINLDTDPDNIDIPQDDKLYPIKEKIFTKFFDDNRYLNEEMLKRWTQSILSRIQQDLDDECCNHGISKVLSCTFVS